ncbi:hypothetical protein U1Q18_044228 [Sarracenia purpurea var. burkii]
MVLFTPVGLAQRTLEVQPLKVAKKPLEFLPFRGWGLLPPVWSDEDIVHCWTSVMKIDGCITQMYESIYNVTRLDGIRIGPACCRAINNIAKTCWPRMFPFNHKAQQLIKDDCATYFGKG